MPAKLRLYCVLTAACLAGWPSFPQLQAADPAAPKADSAHIAKLIQDLGNPLFAERERATDALWRLGYAAKPAVEEASRNQDAEIRSRAAVLLERFNWGVLPDTPKEILAEIRNYRSGEREAQFAAISQLLTLGEPGEATLHIILRNDLGQERGADVFNYLASRLRQIVPRHIVAREYSRAESLLQLNTLGPSEPGHADYAQFMLMQDRLPVAIRHLRSLARESLHLQGHAGLGLVFAYRLARDRDQALATARHIRRGASTADLEESLLEDLGEWQRLAELPMGEDVQSRIGLAMFRHRKAGNLPMVESLAKRATQATFDEGLYYGEVYEAALALLLNGRSQQGIALLQRQRAQPHLLADVLVARQDFDAALSLIDQGQASQPNAGITGDSRLRTFYDMRKARLLAQLGQKDEAKTLFNQIALSIRDRDQSAIQQLLRAEVRAGLPDLASEHTARFLQQFDQFNQAFYLRPGPMEILFEEDAEAAQAWWTILRQYGSREELTQTMTRIRELLSGTASTTRLEQAMTAWTKAEETTRWQLANNRLPESRGPVVTLPMILGAAATAYRAHGQNREAEPYLLKAAEATQPLADPLAETELYGPRSWVFGTNERYRPWLDLGDHLANQGLHAEAARQYYEGWTRFPENPILLFLSGYALTQAGQVPDGQQRMEAAHWIPLGNARMRGRFLEELCNRGLAPAIRRELPLTRDAVWYWERYRGNVWNQVVRASVLLKEFPAASAASERSLHFILRTSGITFVEGAAYVTVPTGIKAYEARGLLEQNQVPEALTLARECLAVLPGAPEIVSPIVQELDRRELSKEADRLFAEAWAVHRRLVETYPESNWAHQNAASLAAACQRSLDEAETLARKAIELDPESRLSQETLAEVHFRKGRRAEALAIMKQLAQREPRNALYQRQLKRYADGPTTSPIPLLIAD